MRTLWCLVVLSAVCTAGCGSSFFAAKKYLTGPVDGVGLKKTTSVVEGNSEQLFPVVTPSKTSNKHVTWSSSDSSVAAVDADGIVTGVKPGNAVVTVTTVEGGFSTSCAVTVTIRPVPVTGVTLNKSSSSILTTKTEQLSAVISPANATNQTLIWKSDNAAVAAVDAAGLVTARTAGTAKIIAASADSGSYAACIFTVTDIPVDVTGVKLNKSSTTIAVGTGNSEKLFAAISPLDATDQNVTWSSSDAAVAAVDALGSVTGMKEGSAVITVMTADGSFTSSCSCTVVTALKSVTGVTLSKSIMMISAGYKEQLSAVIAPGDATNQNLLWSSSNTAAATVDSSGTVTGVADGTAVITATTVDGGLTASCSCTVSAVAVSVDSVALNKTSTVILAGGSETLYAAVSPSLASNKSVSWSSSNSAVASVDSSGTVTGKSAGAATITVTTSDRGRTASCVCTITAAAVSVTGVSISSTLTISTGSSSLITATVTPSDATNQNIIWSSSDSTVATVDGGVVTGKSGGTTTITATSVDGNKTATCTVTVTVPVSSLSIASTLGLVAAGNTFSLTVTFNGGTSAPSDTVVTWKSLDSTVATVSTAGLVTAVGYGTTTIIATSHDGGKTAECVVTVSGYRLKYNANGATGDVPSEALYPTGAVVTLPGNTASNVMTKMNGDISLFFAGWCIDAACTGTVYAAGAAYTMSGENTTLYAKWSLIGASYGGGYIFYYDATAHKGLIVAPSSYSGAFNAMEWSNVENVLVGGTDTALWTGAANTEKIVAQAGHLSSAAKVCLDYRGGGHSDWFLPSKDELYQLYEGRKQWDMNRSMYYWSSSEYDSGSVWSIEMVSNSRIPLTKSSTVWARPVRVFSLP